MKGVANADFQVSGVEINSRDVLPGDLFFALKGENMDGHRFLEMARTRSTAGTFVHQPDADQRRRP